MAEFPVIQGANYKHDYNEIFRFIAAGKIAKIKTYRELCKKDLFFVLYFGLGQTHVNKKFVVNTIREVEDEHYDTLDLWAREHYKSTILTHGLLIQEVIKNPEERICIFSHTRPIAKGFLREIKQALENDPPVKIWFRDIFHKDPRKQAFKWSEDDGLIVKRKSTAKESTFEAWGLVDGQPTSKHFTIRVYDDVVTKDSVTNPEQIKKTLEAYELSQSLGTIGGKKRVLGTHYHFADLYTHLKKKGGYKVRIKPAIDKAGEPVLLTKERLRELKHEQGSYIFSCQQLLQPIPEADQSFNEKWLRFWPANRFSHLNIYILCDPASSKKKTSDYTTFFVIGAGEDEKYYIITMVRDRLNLKERADHLFALHRQYRPLDVGYEKYGMQADIEHFQDRMNRENYRFEITELKGRIAKEDRIRGLVPLFQAGRIYLPDTCVRRNYEGISEDLTKIFIHEEFNAFPIVVHDDMLDGLARIRDPEFDMRFPKSRRHIGPLQGTADGEYDELGY